MDNNTIDPATIVRPSPKDGLGSTRVTSDNLSTEVKPRKVDGSEGLNSKYEVPSTNALMAEKRLAASNNLQMIRERLDEIAKTLNVEMQDRSRDLQFSVDEVTNRFMVTVLDKESGNVVRQIPSDAILKVAHNLEALKGIIFDDRY